MVEVCISVDEYKSRIERLKNELQRRGYTAMFLMNHTYMFWLTGINYLSTERPLGLLVPVDGNPVAVLPQMEVLHWKGSVPWIPEMTTFLDYPGDPHCYNTISDLLKDKKLGKKKIAIDGLGMSSHAPKQMEETFKTLYGHAPSLKIHLEKNLPEVKLENAEEILVNWMLILSEADKRLVREANKWGNLAHTLMMEKVSPGTTHWQVSHEASWEATKKMVETLGIKVELPYRLPAYVNFHAGPTSSYPHSGRRDEYLRKIQVGDICSSWADANVGGYGIEIERTFFIGTPSEKHKKYFNIMMKAQEAAFNQIKPGNTCSEVCKAAYKVFKEAGVWHMVKHHVGHGKPWLGHLPPYFDLGDHTTLKPNMEFSIEPGIYLNEVGGFRHSDTIFVTEDGAEWVTNTTPRDLENNTIKI